MRTGPTLAVSCWPRRWPSSPPAAVASAAFPTARRHEGEKGVGEVTERIAATQTTALPQDLKLRVISSLVLAIVALLCNWAGAWSFLGLSLACALVMSWEWSRIVRGAQLDAATALHGLVVAAGAVLAGLGLGQWAIVLVLVGTGAMLVASLGRHPLVSGIGVVYVGLPA